MLSVLHVCTDFHPSTGGIQQFVLDIARRSAAVGIRASVLCFNRAQGVDGVLPAEDAVDGIRIHRIPFLDLKFYKPALFPQALLRSRDIIHVHGIGAPLDYLVMTRTWHRKPLVVSTHGGIFHTPTLPAIKRLYFKGVQRLVMTGVDAIAACSRSDAALFSGISDKVRLLENAVNVRDYLDLPVERKERGRCLYVGRIAANKHIDRLIEAFAIACHGSAAGHLRIIGPDAESRETEYQALAARLGIGSRVVFVGALRHADLLDEYARGEIFVSASRYEGFGLSALEARAAGCRLFLNDNESFRNLFGSDPAATLVDFEDTAAAGAVWSELLRTRFDAGLLDGRRYLERYSWENKIQEWSGLYRSVLG